MNMRYMFHHARAFNYPLCWNLSSENARVIRNSRLLEIDIKILGVDCFPSTSPSSSPSRSPSTSPSSSPSTSPSISSSSSPSLYPSTSPSKSIDIPCGCTTATINLHYDNHLDFKYQGTLYSEDNWKKPFHPYAVSSINAPMAYLIYLIVHLD